MIAKTACAIAIWLIFTAAAPQPVSVIDFVKIKNNKREEALYFYHNNWKVYREIALKKGYISSYNMLLTRPGSSSYDIMLITTYKDSIQQKNSEANFAEIIKAERPNGPKLLNDIKPADFRETVSGVTVDVAASD
ncbi:MAG: hypothetical protein ABIN13_14845 [Mucilaginibacter sp.]